MLKGVSIFILIVIFMVAPIAGCGGKNNVPPGTEPPPANGGGAGNGNVHEEPIVVDEVNTWVEYSRGLFLAQSREIDGQQYLLVTYGMKNTGGYDVDIVNVEILEDRVQAHVTFTAPAPGQPVTEAITFPYDLKEMAATGLPVEFIASGAEIHVPHLVGLDYLPPIAAESPGIKIFQPAPGSLVGRRFQVKGAANVFEGNFQYRLTDKNGTVLVAGFGTAAMGDWKRFDLNLVVDERIPVAEGLVLELYTESAKDGAVQDLIQIELELN